MIVVTVVIIICVRRRKQKQNSTEKDLEMGEKAEKGKKEIELM